ncbi:MAG: 16S rRNA (uracil(1498)-N(3))-methyltransferase [Acidocella sp.]|nr:16S rRNA (uracil(1498)-N(3))-methyltransferase [Acidocella sp.]
MSTSSIRLFVNVPLAPGLPAPGTEAQAHYLANVMRRGPGDHVLLFNGQDGEWHAAITELTRNKISFTPLTQTRPQTPEPDSWLCFALLKRTKTDLVVEKATELGVACIQPVITLRTQADHVNLERLRAIAIEAAEQCERLTIPEIMAPLTLPALMAKWPENRQLFVADERRTARLLRHTTTPSALLVGPEGGFTDAELVSIDTHPQVSRVSLGAHILRAETAAIAGLALLLATDPPQE